MFFIVSWKQVRDVHGSTRVCDPGLVYVFAFSVHGFHREPSRCMAQELFLYLGNIPHATGVTHLARNVGSTAIRRCSPCVRLTHRVHYLVPQRDGGKGCI